MSDWHDWWTLDNLDQLEEKQNFTEEKELFGWSEIKIHLNQLILSAKTRLPSYTF